jgi:hypothetical protein
MKIKYPIGGFAPGNYFCKCQNCETEFTGDKRSVQCEPCAINMVHDAYINCAMELKNLKAALREVKNGNETIIDFLKK